MLPIGFGIDIGLATNSAVIGVGGGGPGAGVDNLLLADGSSHFLLAASATDVLKLAS